MNYSSYLHLLHRKYVSFSEWRVLQFLLSKPWHIYLCTLFQTGYLSFNSSCLNVCRAAQMLRVIWFVHTHASLPVNMNPELSVLVERCPHIQDVTCRASGSTRAFNTDRIQLNMNCITYSDIQTHAMTQPQVQKPLVSIIGGNYFLYDLLVSQAAVEEFGPPLDAGGLWTALLRSHHSISCGGRDFGPQLSVIDFVLLKSCCFAVGALAWTQY